MNGGRVFAGKCHAYGSMNLPLGRFQLIEPKFRHWQDSRIRRRGRLFTRDQSVVLHPRVIAVPFGELRYAAPQLTALPAQDAAAPEECIAFNTG
jgi:hypothetical protein